MMTGREKKKFVEGGGGWRNGGSGVLLCNGGRILV